MPATKYNLVWEQGATATLGFTWQDADEEPIDLSDWTARMQVRQKVDSPEVLAEFTTDEGIVIDGPEGEVTVSAPGEVTSEWDWPGSSSSRMAVYDLVLSDPSGVDIRLLEGKIKLNLGVTRD
jgi:hypothetical protein